MKTETEHNCDNLVCIWQSKCNRRRERE